MLFLIISVAIAQTPAPELTCSGPLSCGESVGQDTADFFGNLNQTLVNEPDVAPESELKTLETKLGWDSPSDLVSFDKTYFEKNGAETPLPITRAFQKYRLKVNTDDRGIDFVNTNENKSLGLSGPESKPKDVVDVELPANTKPQPATAKKKRSGRTESN